MAIWKEYIDSAYISCAHYLVNNKLHWTERLFWFVAIIIAMGCAYNVISKSVDDYNTQEATYRIDTNYLHWQTPFPSVVICEKKFLTATSKINKIITKVFETLSATHAYKFDEDLKGRISDVAFLRPNDLSAFAHFCKRDPFKCPIGNFSFIMNEIRKKCDDMFTHCDYNGKKFDCCAEFLPVNTTFGTCFGFNNYASRKPDGGRVTDLKWRITRSPGLTSGNLLVEGKHRSLIVNILSPNAVPHIKNEKFVFGDSHVTPLDEKMLYKFYVDTEETITMKEEKVVSIEFRNCRFPDENYLKYFDFYTEAHCEVECYMMAQKKFCGCIIHTCPFGPNEECDLVGLSCIDKSKDLIDEYISNECYCLPECNTTDVQKIGNIAKLNTGRFKELDSKVAIKVIVAAPVLRYIRYVVKTQLDVIVSVGGSASFFLGFSFLSIAQLIYYFFIRSVTDQYRAFKTLKRMTKERKMDENFTRAKRKLKLGMIERNIKKNARFKVVTFAENLLKNARR